MRVDGSRAVLSMLAWVVLAGCGHMVDQSVEATPTAIFDRDHGWQLRASRDGGFLPLAWELVSHSPHGELRESDKAVVGRFAHTEGAWGGHLQMHQFDFRFRHRAARAHLWARLVPLDVPRAALSLPALANAYVEQLDGEPPLVASLYARSEGGRDGSSSLVASGVRGGVTRYSAVPNFAEFPTTPRVSADVEVIDRRAIGIGSAPAQITLVTLHSHVPAETAALALQAEARGEDPVPREARLAFTLVRLPGRVRFSTSVRSYDMPCVLLVAYWAPTATFDAGLADYLALLSRLRVD